MKVLGVTHRGPAEIVRVSRQLGLKTEDITSHYPIAVIAVEEVVYVHVGGVTIALPRADFTAKAFWYDITEFPAKETCA